jgi:hypothetical protein
MNDRTLAEIDRLQREYEALLGGARGAPAGVNGGPAESIHELINRIDREAESEERDRLAEHQKALEAKLDRLTDKIEELAATTRPRLTRMGMSALAKSQYIRRFGLQNYQLLPLAF